MEEITECSKISGKIIDAQNYVGTLKACLINWKKNNRLTDFVDINLILCRYYFLQICPWLFRFYLKTVLFKSLQQKVFICG